MIRVDWDAPRIVVPLDYWVYGPTYVARVHITPRRGLFDPSTVAEGFNPDDLESKRSTVGTFAMRPRVESWRS